MSELSGAHSVASGRATPKGLFPLRVGRLGWREAGLLGVLVFFALFFGRGLLAGYSYWYDELFTVLMCSISWEELYRRWILPDVTPPFYYYFLKPWIGLFGASEISTRIPSLLFALVSLGSLSWFLRARAFAVRLFALLLMGGLPLVAYFSQETRHYTLVRLLSSWVTFLALMLRRRSQPDAALQPADPSRAIVLYYFISLLLALTHYFGLLYVLALSALNFLERRIDGSRVRTLALMASVLVWPLLHARLGKLLSHTGGNFWIQVEPFWGTLRNFLEATFPVVLRDGQFVWPLLLAAAVLLVIGLRGLRGSSPYQVLAQAEAPAQTWDETRFLVQLVGLVLVGILLLDLRSPLSTTRNFIVLVPPVVLVITNLFGYFLGSVRGSRLWSSVFLGAVALLLLAQLQISYERLSAKIVPRQNWKDLGAFVETTGLCDQGCQSYGAEPAYIQYYMKQAKLEPRTSEQIKESGFRLDSGRPFLGFHDAYRELPAIAASNPEWQCLEPTQADEAAVFVFLPRDRELKDGATTLKPCQPPQRAPYFWTGR
jgi:mannosyltransferase